MPSTFKSPFATGFKSAVNRGASFNQTVENLAKRHNVTVSKVWESLYKAGCCNRQKFNGQWIYFPNFSAKWSKNTARHAQCNTWQCFIEWCLTSGACTPKNLASKCGTQSAFMKACRTWWNGQFSATTSKATGSKKAKTAKSAKASKTTKSVKASKARSTKTTGRSTTLKAKSGRTTTAKRTKTTGSGNYRFPVARKASATRKAA